MELLPGASPEGLDMVGKLLHFNPEKRTTAPEILTHPFVSRFHDPSEEPELDRGIVPYLDDNIQLSINDYREKLYEARS